MDVILQCETQPNTRIVMERQGGSYIDGIGLQVAKTSGTPCSIGIGIPIFGFFWLRRGSNGRWGRGTILLAYCYSLSNPSQSKQYKWHYNRKISGRICVTQWLSAWFDTQICGTVLALPPKNISVTFIDHTFIPSSNSLPVGGVFRQSLYFLRLPVGIAHVSPYTYEKCTQCLHPLMSCSWLSSIGLDCATSCRVVP